MKALIKGGIDIGPEKSYKFLQTLGRLRETLERLSLNCFAKILGL